MKIIKKENRLCHLCMQVHDVAIVEIEDNNIFKGENVSFIANYEYCEIEDEYIENEDMMSNNDISFKDAYRKKMNLLTSWQIQKIRTKYNINQKDFAKILDWGGATIARYEKHQVQDKPHDNVLKKIDEDPEWFLVLLNSTKDDISHLVYQKSHDAGRKIYGELENNYLIKCIYSQYSIYENALTNGNVELDLNKVQDLVNYIASKVDNLFRVKLVKLLWYCDALFYKNHGVGITGLIYCKESMGTLPLGYNEILSLRKH